MFETKFLSPNGTADLKKGDHLLLVSSKLPVSRGKHYTEVEIVSISGEVRNSDEDRHLTFELSTPYGSTYHLSFPELLKGIKKYQYSIEVESGKRSFYLGEMPQDEWSNGKIAGWNLAIELIFQIAMLPGGEEQFRAGPLELIFLRQDPKRLASRLVYL